MESELSGFRRWWRPPRRMADREDERRVSFLELFYDLVYVVVIAEIAHHLALHVDPRGVAESAFLFVLVWVAWVNGTWYHDLHGHNDVRTRVFTFAQMFTVAGMAVFVHSAFGAGAAGFALSFAAYQLILTNLWWRTGVHDPDHRPLSTPYSLAFLLSTALFGVSAFVPPTPRLVLWGAAMVLSVSLPLVVFGLRRNEPEVRTQAELSLRPSASAVERFGLFTIIVLGEVLVGVVQGVASHPHLDATVAVTAALGMLVAIAMWWLYFDYVSMRRPSPRLVPNMAWLYLHVALTWGIVATGAATLNVVESAGEPLEAAERWLLVGSLALALVCLTGLMVTLDKPDTLRRAYHAGEIVTFAVAAGVVVTGFSGLDTIPLLGVLVALVLVPVLYGLQVWIKVFGAHDLAP